MLSAFPFSEVFAGVSDSFAMCRLPPNCVASAINVSYFSCVCCSLLFNVCVKYCTSWTCSLTQVQTWAMTLRTIRLATYSFNTVCILSFPLVIRYLLYLYFIYNIIAFAVVVWWLVGGFCTYGVKHLRNILARRWLLRTCERKSKHPSQISKFILALSAFRSGLSIWVWLDYVTSSEA